jgi:hypothetical protein
MNVDVAASGAHHTVLKMKYILVNKVIAYQISYDHPEMLRTMEDMGLKKFVITDGYDETCPWNLNH